MHNALGTKKYCPLSVLRGIRLIEHEHTGFSIGADRDFQKVSILKRYPLYRGVRLERVDSMKYMSMYCNKFSNRKAFASVGNEKA